MILRLLLLSFFLINQGIACTLTTGSVVPDPAFANPPGALTTQPVSVSLSSGSTNLIFYTLDGTNPSQISPLYDPANPIEITQTTILKSVAWCGDNGLPSPVTAWHYTFHTNNLEHEVTNTLRMAFRLVPPVEEGGLPYYIGKYEVTQSQWTSLIATNPSRFDSVNAPVEQVSYKDVLEFVRRLNEREAPLVYRLPTAAEWFHAARASSSFNYHFGDTHHLLSYYSWYGLNSGNATRNFGERLPNSWGIYDTHGNVREWVEEKVNGNNSMRFVLNCGYDNIEPTSCYSHMMTPVNVSYASHNLGFRLLLESTVGQN